MTTATRFERYDGAPWALGHHLAAVDVERRTVHEARGVGGEEQDGLGDLHRLAEAANWDRLRDLAALLGCAQGLDALGGGRTRGDGVDGDAVGTDLQRQVAREADDAP